MYCQVWLTVYFNKSGLLDVMTSQKICTLERFEAFLLGFNQASPLFSIVDVGGGKEAADVKVKGAEELLGLLWSVNDGSQNLSVCSLGSLKYGRFSLVVQYIRCSPLLACSHNTHTQVATITDTAPP